MQYRLTDKPGNERFPVPITGERLPSTELRPIYSGTQERSPSLSDFLEILVRRKWIILGFTLLVLIPTVWVNLKAKPIYKAEGFIEMSPEMPKVTKFESVISNYVGRKSEEFYLTQMELLKSAALARRVIQRLELDKNPAFNPALAESLEKKDLLQRAIDGVFAFKHAVVKTVEDWFRSGDPGPVRPEDHYFASLRTQKWLEALFNDALKVEAKFETSILQVSFDSTSPALAADVVNVLIDEYSNWQMDRRIDAAKTAKEQLEKQIKLARNEVERAESKILLFSREKGIVSLDSRLNLVYQQLEKINEALAKAEAERIQKEEFYNQAKSSDISTSPLVLQNSLISGLKQQYIDLMGEYEKLRVFFKDDYPTVNDIYAAYLSPQQHEQADEVKS